MTAGGLSDLISLATRELALFAAVGFLLGGVDDLIVDLAWIGRSLWRSLVIFRRIPVQTLAPCHRRRIPDGSPCSWPPGGKRP